MNTESGRVLVIDCEAPIRRLLRSCLERNGYDVVEAGTAEAGIDEAMRSSPDIVLLDTALPDFDGLAVLKTLRGWTRTPVMVISAQSREQDKIAALDNGASDYLTKPFSTGELLARLRAVQRLARSQPLPAVFKSGGLSVDLATRTVKLGDRKVRLTATEYSMLQLFIQHAGKVLTHGQIIRQVWGKDEAGKMGQLRVYMTYLREKLETNPAAPELLITEPRIGYRLAVPE